MLRAGSDLTVAAVAPLAALSAACVFGLGAAGSGDPASAQGGEKPQSGPRPSASATEQVGKHRATTARPTTSQASANPTTSQVTTSQASGTLVPAAGSVPTQQGSTGASPTKAAEPTTAPAPVAPTVVEAPVPVPTATPTAEPTTAVLTEAEATAQCLESGISALDVTGLADCVADLLP